MTASVMLTDLGRLTCFDALSAPQKPTRAKAAPASEIVLGVVGIAAIYDLDPVISLAGVNGLLAFLLSTVILVLSAKLLSAAGLLS